MADPLIPKAPSPIVDPTNPNIQRWDDIGLTLIHNFISEAEEATMIAAFHDADPRTGGRKRLSQHFGYHFDYTTFGASESHHTPVPSYIEAFLPRLPIQSYLPDQFTVQYYPPGSGIPPHVDTHSMFAEALYSLSFGSAVPMVFRMSGPNDARKMRQPKRSLMVSSDANTSATTSAVEPVADSKRSEETTQQEEPSWELLLPARSLLVMEGPSRYGYTHGIKGRKTDIINGETVLREGRYSITMRTVRRGDEIGCTCAYPGVCDARIREELERGSATSQYQPQLHQNNV
ncbi:hypothetical protein B0H66DRAFT_170420 [Apodospora peruviana]|uniref:Fe2OG dioxygenase domain-containing protein n=1 Tax=Apodospora peruviana TaxID=516989 RepID=A0AAE0IKZ6_9PEZI|nr:hypothetical protein B0H66DRAFT_170420 [Apodospora peruviana]